MAHYIVKALKSTLKSPLTATATSVVLKKLQDHKGNNLTTANFGTFGCIVIKQGDSIEIIKFTAISTATDDTATLTVATNGRHLNASTPYAGSSTGLAFQSGAEVIVTNDPYSLAQFGDINNAQTWAALQTFSLAPVSSVAAVSATELVRKQELDAAALGSITNAPLVIPGNAGETVTIDQLVYLDSVDQEWKLCDADTAASVENVKLGITRGAGTDGNAISGGVTVLGEHEAASAIFTAGKVFASNTAGGFATSTGTKEVSLGIAKSTTKIDFFPRYDQMITEDIQDALAGSSGTPSNLNKYVTADDVSDAAVSGKIVRASGTALPALDGSNLVGIVVDSDLKFGGDGSDGALTITSGTTDLDVGTAKIYTKNYTSISITGSGALTFSNPNSTGTIILLRSQGDVTLTSSAAPMIDASGMGGAGGTGNGAGNTGAGGRGGGCLTIECKGAWNFTTASGISVAGDSGVNGDSSGSGTVNGGNGSDGQGTPTFDSTKGLGSEVGSVGTGGAGVPNSPYRLLSSIERIMRFCIGAGGGGASVSSNDRGGGGGGGGGLLFVLYNTLTADSGTVTVSAGAGGTGFGLGRGGGGGGGVSAAGSSGSSTTGGAGGAGLSVIIENIGFV